MVYFCTVKAADYEQSGKDKSIYYREDSTDL